MATVNDALEAARQLARQISSTSTDVPLPASEITRFVEQFAAPERLAEIPVALEHDALARLDHSPRQALGLSRVAYELSRATVDNPMRAETALTLAMVLNRMGEFRDALAKSCSAAAEFEQRGETRQAARSYSESAWANSFLGYLKTAMEDVEHARERDSSPLSQARCDWIEARVLRDQGNYDAAKELFVKSRAVFESGGIPLDAARCSRELAHTYLRAERAETIPLLQSVRQIFESANCGLDKALCDWLMGLRLNEMNQYTPAQAIIFQAREEFSSLGANFFLAWCDIELGLIFYRLNRFEESLEATQRARDYFHSHGVPVEVSACDINIGITYHEMNRYDEALSYYQEAADLALSEGREVRAGRIFNNMGSAYQKQGLYARAMDFHQRALQIYSDKGLDSLTGNALINLASVCRQLEEYPQALDHLQRARELFIARNLPIQLAGCEFNLADVHWGLDSAKTASAHLSHAREIYAENGIESMVAVCNRLLAYLANEKGERARALSLISESRATFLKHHQIVDAALCDLIEGELCFQWNEQAAAQQAFFRAQAILSPGFPDQAWRVESGLGDCSRAAGEPAVAIKHYLNAVQTIARSRSILVTEQLSNDYFSSRQRVYDRALKIAMELDAPEFALETIEASKAQVFLSLLQNRRWNISNDQNNPTVAQLLTREKELRYQLDALRTRATVAPPKDQEDALRGDVQADVSTAALQELNALSQAYESVVARLRLTSNGLTGVSSPAPFTLDRFRELATARLGAHWAALDYYLSGDDLTCLVVQPTRLARSSKKLDKYDRAILENCVSQEHDLREMVYSGTLRGYPAPSPGVDYLSHLYHLLVPGELDAEVLIVAPHGPLHALPFHALKDGDDFLIQHHTLVYTPSLQALQLLLNDEGAVSTQSLAIGLADFENRMPALPSADAEIEQFKVAFGEQAQVLWGERATRKELFALNQSDALQNCKLLHFATHAILDHDAPHRSRVLLHDEALTVLDIMELRLNARLVTLSACETALGQAGRGDELVGLARAFFYAGARALAASLWKVEDRSIAELIGRFYRHLVDGENTAAALRRAQVEMIQAGYSPFQWASLVMIGRP